MELLLRQDLCSIVPIVEPSQPVAGEIWAYGLARTAVRGDCIVSEIELFSWTEGKSTNVQSATTP